MTREDASVHLIAATQTKEGIKSRLLLEVAIRKCFPVLELFASEYEALLT